MSYIRRRIVFTRALPSDGSSTTRISTRRLQAIALSFNQATLAPKSPHDNRSDAPPASIRRGMSISACCLQSRAVEPSPALYLRGLGLHPTGEQPVVGYSPIVQGFLSRHNHPNFRLEKDVHQNLHNQFDKIATHQLKEKFGKK